MKFPRPILCFFSAAALALSSSSAIAVEDFYVGTYTHWYGSKGIYHFQFDPGTGTISGGELAVETPNPSFVVVHPNEPRVYACNEDKVGSLRAFALGPDHHLQFINEQDSKGGWPCHLSFDRTMRYLLVANYMNGTVAVLPITHGGGLGAATGFDQHRGQGPNADRQEGPHAHSIYADPANRFVYSCDLGNDHVVGYRFHPDNGTITTSRSATTAIAPGSGPRHLVLAPHGFVYVLSEMSCTITVLQRDEATGGMRTLQTIPSTVAKTPDFEKQHPKSGYVITAAEIALHPSGRFLYASNRGLNRQSPSTIGVFSVSDNGRLTYLEDVSTRGRVPRNFAIDPSGRWLLAANQNSNDIFVFALNARTGKLTPVGGRVRVGNPACITFLPTPAKL
jgi:6-phosphogluconolactonase